MTATESTTEFPDLYMGGTLLTTRLSARASQRYEQALWYCWGRQDAGDEATKANHSGHDLGDDFGFAEFAALEAEAFERQQRFMLANVADQYGRFIASVGTRS